MGSGSESSGAPATEEDGCSWSRQHSSPVSGLNATSLECRISLNVSPFTPQHPTRIPVPALCVPPILRELMGCDAPWHQRGHSSQTS